MKLKNRVGYDTVSYVLLQDDELHFIRREARQATMTPVQAIRIKLVNERCEAGKVENAMQGHRPKDGGDMQGKLQ